MQTVPYVFFFALGAIIGSFLNVVIYRLHTSKSLGGRSHCMSCGETLLWYELLPIVSYLFLRGRCNVCASRITARYVAVELLTALLFMLGWYAFKGEMFLLVASFILFSFLVVIFVYDIRHTIIPDEMTLGVLITALGILGHLYFTTGNMTLLYSHILGGVCATFFFWCLWYFSKGRWIGFGDVKLVFPLGLMTGGWATFSMVVYSFWIGAFITLSMLGINHILKKGKTRMFFGGLPLTIKSEVPFAPFLLAGFLLTYVFHADVFFIIERVFSF